MGGNGINNGSAFGRANRDPPPMPGDPEPEDTTGLKMLEEFLRRRGDKLNQERSERDGNERK